MLNVSVTQNPLVRAHRPKPSRNCNPSLYAGPENFSPPQMGAQKLATLPQNLPPRPPPSANS